MSRAYVQTVNYVSIERWFLSKLFTNTLTIPRTPEPEKLSSTMELAISLLWTFQRLQKSATRILHALVSEILQANETPRA
mmetsp:Transcript_36049/g.144132  ORF Transcript_36049/g.144132 Transcript_36049/m.144132 type:complete len:80 (+) Transcript_36049:893-1132(+)